MSNQFVIRNWVCFSVPFNILSLSPTTQTIHSLIINYGQEILDALYFIRWLKALFLRHTLRQFFEETLCVGSFGQN